MSEVLIQANRLIGGNDAVMMGTFFAVRSWAGCITNMFGFDLRQAQGACSPPLAFAKTGRPYTSPMRPLFRAAKQLDERRFVCCDIR